MATFKTAVVPVLDLQRSLEFYRDVLGLAPTRTSETFAFFENGLELYDAEAFMAAALGETSGAVERLGRDNLSLYFETDDVESAFAAASAAAVIVQPVTRQPWGQLLFRFRDPDGHLIEVGSEFVPADN